MTTWVTICDTCKHADWEARAETVTDGERFAQAIEQAAQGVEGVRTRRHSCLMGCTRACNVTVQANGKLSYSLGEFAPTMDAAEGVVAYARLHADSDSGVVPYRQWPQAIKGHFVSRHPPLPTDD